MIAGVQEKAGCRRIRHGRAIVNLASDRNRQLRGCNRIGQCCARTAAGAKRIASGGAAAVGRQRDIQLAIGQPGIEQRCRNGEYRIAAEPAGNIGQFGSADQIAVFSVDLE